MGIDSDVTTNACYCDKAGDFSALRVIIYSWDKILRGSGPEFFSVA